MEFELTEEQQMVAKSAREVVEDFPPEYWRKKEEEGKYPADFWKALIDAGFTKITIPQKYGGAGMGITELAVAMEELGACGMAAAWLLAGNSVFGAAGIEKHGDEKQKKKWLPKLGDGAPFSLALTEPDAGSNTLNSSTRAKKDGNEWVINGSKMFISGLDLAEGMILVARTKPKAEVTDKTKGLTEFLVRLPRDSVKINKIPKHGCNIFNTFEVGIDELRVPEDSVIGEEGMGWYQVLSTLNPERITLTAGAIGAANKAVQMAVDYSKERKVFGVPIGSHQGLQFPLAEAHSRLESAKLLNLKAAWMRDNGASEYEVGKVANTSKIAATNAAIDATYHAMQVFGGYGYAKEYDIERFWREINLIRLAPVAQQLALAFTGEHVLGMPSSY